MSMHTAARRLAVACALALPVAGLTATVATPAHADVPVVKAVKQTALNTATEMSVTVTCSPGKVPAGGGAETGGKAYLKESRPTYSNGWKVTARKTADVGPWRLRAFAWCIDRPADYRIVKNYVVKAPDEKVAEANVICPSGTKSLGVGGQAGGDPNGAYLTGLGAWNDGLGYVLVGRTNTAQTTNPWSATVYQVCGSLPSATLAGGVDYVEEEYVRPGVKEASVACPSPKKRIAFGAQLRDGWNNTDTNGVLATKVFLTDITDDGVGAAKETVPHDWVIVPMTICA